MASGSRARIWTQAVGFQGPHVDYYISLPPRQITFGALSPLDLLKCLEACVWITDLDSRVSWGMAWRCSAWCSVSWFQEVKAPSRIWDNALWPNAMFPPAKMSCMKYYVDLVVNPPHKNLEWMETISEVNIISKENSLNLCCIVL